MKYSLLNVNWWWALLTQGCFSLFFCLLLCHFLGGVVFFGGGVGFLLFFCFVLLGGGGRCERVVVIGWCLIICKSWSATLMGAFCWTLLVLVTPTSNSLLPFVAASLISPWLLWWPPAESHYNIYDHSVVGYVSHAHSIVLLYSVGNKIATTFFCGTATFFLDPFPEMSAAYTERVIPLIFLTLNYSWWCHQMKTFSALLALCVRGIHRSSVNSPHNEQWRGTLIFSLVCAQTNGCVNNRYAGDLRCHCTHYDVTVMSNSLLGNTCLWYMLSLNIYAHNYDANPSKLYVP